jgi:hypothetical protein
MARLVDEQSDGVHWYYVAGPVSTLHVRPTREISTDMVPNVQVHRRS